MRPHRSGIHVWVVAQHPCPEARPRHARHRAPDASGADEAHRLAGNVRRPPLADWPDPTLALHGGVDGHQPLGQRDHQRECALRHRLLGVLRHVDDGNAARLRRLDVDGVNADTVLDDGLEALSTFDDFGSDGRVAHQQQVGVADLARQFVLADAVRQQHQFAAALAQDPVDLGALQLAVGPDNLRPPHGASEPRRWRSRRC